MNCSLLHSKTGQVRPDRVGYLTNDKWRQGEVLIVRPALVISNQHYTARIRTNDGNFIVRPQVIRMVIAPRIAQSDLAAAPRLNIQHIRHLSYQVVPAINTNET